MVHLPGLFLGTWVGKPSTHACQPPSLAGLGVGDTAAPLGAGEIVWWLRIETDAGTRYR